ncbi:MAG: hypothetical protein IJ806_05555 [Ruminococcus sp.]|nr:hypothetical protein [Ruminococcus sp.]
MTNNKKVKNKYGNPQKNIEARKAAEAAAREVETAMIQQKKAADKPLIMRILVLAVAVVMILGVVVGAAMGF